MNSTKKRRHSRDHRIRLALKRRLDWSDADFDDEDEKLIAQAKAFAEAHGLTSKGIGQPRIIPNQIKEENYDITIPH